MIKIVKNMQKSWVWHMQRHRPADLMIMGATLLPSMTPFYDQSIGLNASTLLAMILFVIPLAALPFQLRLIRKDFQIMSRILMISGGTVRLVAAFQPPAFESTMTSLALLLAGSVMYISRFDDEPTAEGLEKDLAFYDEMKLDAPFTVINLCADTVDMAQLAALAKNLRTHKNLYPLVMHFRIRRPRIRERSRISRGYLENYTQSEIEAKNILEICHPNESSEFSIVGCSLTGFDFLICGHYIDSPQKRMEISNDLLSRLVNINTYRRHELSLGTNDMLGLCLNKERLGINLHVGGLRNSVHYHIRKRWNDHLESLKPLNQNEVDRIMRVNVAMPYDESPFYQMTY